MIFDVRRKRPLLQVQNKQDVKQNLLQAIIFTVIGLLIGVSTIKGQSISDLGYIYGVITTDSDKTYEGYMRWGKEEVAWHDVFNSTKRKNKHKKPSEDKSLFKDLDWNIGSLWSNNYGGSTRSFACLFGDIDRLELRGSERVDVYFKNGEMIEVDGGSNDIGERIVLHDAEQVKIQLSWKNIDLIQFKSPPHGSMPDYDLALYGILETRKGAELEGYIKWDIDERLTTDILDGHNCCYKDEMPFAKIIKIRSEGSSSLVTLNNDETIEMSGTNDVNKGNRGIGIYVEGVGSIEIPWTEFKQVSFENRTIAGPQYDFFQSSDRLEGVLETYDEDEYEGYIVFDMDEMYPAEMLDGDDGNIEYQIPFRNIKKIIPKNDDYSIVVLHNGDEILLGDTQDVSDNNDGIIVVGKNKENVHIDWDEVSSITFKK
ncbi:MAG: hypothetical protein ACI9FN_001680 [Saprospiraceae bacterium]|jgi:hypothetical protein